METKNFVKSLADAPGQSKTNWTQIIFIWRKWTIRDPVIQKAPFTASGGQ